jgi:hypothetical protein
MERHEIDTKQPHAGGVASGLFAGIPTATPVFGRTIALIAAISLAAFALYMTRPHAGTTDANRTLSLVSGSEPAPGASTHTEMNASSHSEGQNSAFSQQSATNRVTVNGKEVPVPKDGNLHKTITDGNSTTRIDISSSGDSSKSATSSNVSVQSTSVSSSDGSKEP